MTDSDTLDGILGGDSIRFELDVGSQGHEFPSIVQHGLKAKYRGGKVWYFNGTAYQSESPQFIKILHHLSRYYLEPHNHVEIRGKWDTARIQDNDRRNDGVTQLHFVQNTELDRMKT